MISHYTETVLPYVVKLTPAPSETEADAMISWCWETFGRRADYAEMLRAVPLVGSWYAPLAAFSIATWRFETYEQAFAFVMRWR